MRSDFRLRGDFMRLSSARRTLGCALLALSLLAAGSRAEEIPRIAPPEEVINFEPGGLQIQVVQAGNLIEAHQARAKYGVTGAGMTICVMDTGINSSHVDFGNGSLLGGMNFTSSDPTKFGDGDGHGTNVAGIAMANGAQHTGMAPGAKVFAMKVLGTNGGDFAWLLNALTYARDNRVSLGITVINMSLGDTGNYRSVPNNTTFNQIQGVIDELRAAGVVVCVAAGNDFYGKNSVQGMSFPAICSSTTSVGAVYDASIGGFSYGSGAIAYTTGPRRITPFSQRLHPNVSSTFKTDMFAPGAAMTSAGIGSSTASSTMHGTSQASPCLAGVVLLMQEFYKKRTGTMPTVDQIESWLSQSAENIVDGDDEDDNVANTGQTFQLVNAMDVLDLIGRGTNQNPTLQTPLPANQLQTVEFGNSFAAPFVGADLDGDVLTLEVQGLPPGATLTAPSGTRQPGPFETILEWTPSESELDVVYPVTVRYRDPFDVTAEISFSLTSTTDNRRPTIAPIASESIECIDGQHLVTLAATVDDADDDPLTVTWKVDGVVEQVDPSVVAGSDLTFDFDYSHGTHAVQVTVSDGLFSASTGATVTVKDTVDPKIFVAADVTVPNDPGQAYASGVVLETPTVSDTSGHPVTLSNDAPSIYFVGETVVTWTATDQEGHIATATQKVTVVDQELPVIQWQPNVRSYCDPGRTYATLVLLPPTAIDNAPGVIVTSDGRTRFPIGTTKIVWTATDSSGNRATFTQTATVLNRKPRANAGQDVTIFTASEKGVRVVLDGSRSSDPDLHKLKYVWNAKGVALAPKNGRKTAGTFRPGTTTVTLTVTDPGGLKHKDTVRVIVKLKNGRPRPRGSDANRSFELAAQQAGEAAANGDGGGAAFAALAYSQAATAYGDAAGEFVRWEEGQSEDDALLSYAELRAMQAAYGEAAASALLSAYAETGDQSLLSAYGYAAFGTAYAAADLKE